jgi:hypothetical protein
MRCVLSYKRGSYDSAEDIVGRPRWPEFQSAETPDGKSDRKQRGWWKQVAEARARVVGDAVHSGCYAEKIGTARITLCCTEAPESLQPMIQT